MSGDLRGKLLAELDRYRNRDFLKAMMAVCALTALADGEFHIAEKYEVERIIDTNGILRSFDPKRAVKVLDEYIHAIRTGDRDRVLKVLNNKIARFAIDYKASRTLMRAAYIVIAADGEVTDAERAEFDRISRLLEHNPEKFWADLKRWA
jgi:tellurite resistance protein TerB